MGKPVTGSQNNENETTDERMTTWKFEEKERFVKALYKGQPFKSKNGKINWKLLQDFIKTKSMEEVKQFAKHLHAVENGKQYPEFLKKAAVDVWRELADKTTQPGDNIIGACIPQVLTVAALEPVNSSSDELTQDSASKENNPAETPSFSQSEATAITIDLPNYSQIYNYLSAITCDRNIPELTVTEAAILLDLLEDLILTLSKSETLVQREFMHEKYKELRTHMDVEPIPNSKEMQQAEGSKDNLKHSSTNPFGIPFEFLDFKGFPKNTDT